MLDEINTASILTAFEFVLSLPNACSRCTDTVRVQRSEQNPYSTLPGSLLDLLSCDCVWRRVLCIA